MTEYYIEILTSTTCFCGATKEKRMAFCKSCYYSLPRDMRNSLYTFAGQGFEEAYDAACNFLKQKP